MRGAHCSRCWSICAMRVFAVGQVAIAVEEEVAEGGGEGVVGGAEEQHGAACGFSEEGLGLFKGGLAGA